MKPYDYQIEKAELAYEVLKEDMIVYLAMEERTGKTLTSILVAELSNSIKTVLVITKKKALDGWFDTLKAFKHEKIYTVVNYHQAHKQKGKFDLVIIDEAHNYISSYPKPGKLWKEVKQLTKGLPLIYISATPYAQGPQQLFHQFALSSWSPWLKHKNFYTWFQLFGKPYTMEINGINIPQYDKINVDMTLGCVKHLFITATRQELGFEHEPQDYVHDIELGEATRNVYNELIQHDLVELSVGMLVCDTSPKLRTSLHQIEGGTIKIDDSRFVLGNTEKVDFILDKFGDNESLVIMYNYIAEKEKLEQHFKKAKILQATSFAEGVDLHEYKDLVIYSQDFSTARHTQRRARQCNKKRDIPIDVHYLLVKGAISSQVYKTVSVNKKNFVDSVFNRSTI
jgi:hypothetical protein